MGRKKTTGRFDTRGQLEARVVELYHSTTMNVNQIAAHCEVSPGTAYQILDVPLKKEAAKKEPRVLTQAEMDAIEAMTEGAKSVLGTCGHGYAPDEHPVHLPRRVMNDLFFAHDLDEDYERRPVVLGAKWANLTSKSRW
jgi:hypothetical protein